MRRKTEEKKQAIIKAAREIFKELGFERTSMSKICTRFGGSKMTLYNYFSSKEELFMEVISIANAEEFELVHSIIDNKKEIIDVKKELYEFGSKLLNYIYSPKVKKLRRLTMNQAGINDLGKITYNSRILKSKDIISEYLQKAININQIKKTDTSIAAKHLYALLESELMYQFLFQVDVEFSEKEMNEMAKRAVDVFIFAYAV